MKRFALAAVLTAFAAFVFGCTKNYYSTNPAPATTTAKVRVGISTPADVPLGNPAPVPDALSVTMMDKSGTTITTMKMEQIETIPAPNGEHRFYQAEVELSIPAGHSEIFQYRVENGGFDVTQFAQIKGSAGRYPDWFTPAAGSRSGVYFGLECNGELDFRNVPRAAIGRVGRIFISTRDSLTPNESDVVKTIIQEKHGDFWQTVPIWYRSSALFGQLLAGTFVHEGSHSPFFYTYAPIAIAPFERKTIRIRAERNGEDVMNRLYVNGPFESFQGTKDSEGFYRFTVLAGDELPLGGGLGKIPSSYATGPQK